MRRKLSNVRLTKGKIALWVIALIGAIAIAIPKIF